MKSSEKSHRALRNSAVLYNPWDLFSLSPSTVIREWASSFFIGRFHLLSKIESRKENKNYIPEL